MPSDDTLKVTRDEHVIEHEWIPIGTLLLRRALIDVEHQNVELSSSRRAQAERMLKAGEFTKVDVLRAEAAQGS